MMYYTVAMPELPEVQNTVNGINKHAVGRTITKVWSDYDSPFYYGKKQIKDPEYFAWFSKRVTGTTIVKAVRRAKHIFVTLDSGDIIAVHMKMTGHFLYGHWKWNDTEQSWQPESGFWNKTWPISKEEVRKTMPLSDPFNNFIHLLFYLDNGMHLAFSDMRKFASVTLLSNQEEIDQADQQYGPEPLKRGMTAEVLFARVKNRGNRHIKTALLDQSLIAGYGNIYTDEALFAISVHPESKVSAIPEEKWSELFDKGNALLRLAIKHGGDSMGDYRRIDGTGGSFHDMHTMYQKEKTPCTRCGTIIVKKQVDARVARFCPNCQVLYS